LRGSGAVVLKAYADGVLRHTSAALTLTAAGIIERLPSGFLATQWSFLVEGQAGAKLSGMAIATTPTELQRA
jgi:hypothetical protein